MEISLELSNLLQVIVDNLFLSEPLLSIILGIAKLKEQDYSEVYSKQELQVHLEMEVLTARRRVCHQCFSHPSIHPS